MPVHKVEGTPTESLLRGNETLKATCSGNVRHVTPFPPLSP